MAKSQQTGIRLRVNTFGDSQSSNFIPTPHLTTYHLKKKTYPNLDYLAHL